MKMNLKTKYMALFLLVGLLPAIIVSVLAYWQSSREVQEQVYRALDMYAGLTDAEMEGYFSEREGDAAVLATTRDVYQSLNILQGGQHQGQTIGSIGDVTDPMWLDRVAILDDVGPTIVEEYGYAVVFLTSPQGHVVYSTDEDMIGVDLSTRDYIRGSLQGTSTWSELFYSDVVHSLCMVFSVPVLSEGTSGRITGTLNLLMDDTRIDAVVHEGLHELGETADAYLINESGLLLTNTLLGDFQQGAALNQRIDTHALELLNTPIRRGQLEFHADAEYPDYMGNMVLGALTVTLLGDRPVGLVIEIDRAEAFAGLYRLRTIMIVLTIVFAIAIAIASFFIAVNQARPIESLAAVAGQVASGDLTIKTDVDRGDEIGDLAQAFNAMVDNLRDIVVAVKKSADDTASTSQQLASGTEESNATIEEVTSSLAQFTSSTEELSRDAQEMGQAADSCTDLSADGQKQMQSTEDKMQQIITSSQATSETIRELNKASEEIGNITSVISNVADQTNLLALNAAIEAARAGEHGRGFAVVADEVRHLAEETQKSAAEINTIISRLTSRTDDAVQMMEENEAKIIEGEQTLQLTGKSFDQITEEIRKIAGMIEGVASASEEISANSEEISAATEQQSASMQQISSSSQQLAGMAQELNALVDRLTV